MVLLSWEAGCLAWMKDIWRTTQLTPLSLLVSLARHQVISQAAII